MKRAVVTGASSGIGKEITLRLLKLDYEVIGISRSITDEDFNNPYFKAMQANLADESSTLEVCNYLKKESVDILINCAGFGRFEPHEELSANTITSMTFLNLTAPMLLTNALLRSLKKNDGYLININSIEAIKTSKFAGVYSSTKAGLKAFSDSLFEETRKSGLSVTNINPDMTQTSFYDELRFDTSDKEEERLLASDIADAVEHILTMRKGAVISDYTIRSLKFGISKKRL
ncbi:NAD(P)-dependent oxidoreductase, short-chain dehydrogenases/reductases family [Sulfurimonas gotlandica GD1]|uniref:NAD(P)-dependent oxidoreductase, short-chain dehydrogenases/reductases family n=1 Tax=Sulfurimonas gotlandica (strain DSM 19862 / JCM 16533 / GD1) TaxID=929558 RepID=B6BGD0_SULGG|nr:SDR family NAD(P)-dependent oxidoreductase [Sulfurimonas gotlandica]EDZ63146.1 probable short-chain dehydrogenase [Sulfurimonas gotlandica GD1]EHP29557.1 NAD(P)-dependent oxidoreductase, short-chain dehydrogenases/reductases family [Sulfurimonas gotlandica GD1]